MGVLPTLFKLWPWVDLDPFYNKVKFGHIGFCMGKSKTYLFFGNHCSLVSQSCLKYLAKWVNEVECVSKDQRSRSFFDLDQRSLRFQCWKLFFSKTVRRFGTKVHMKAWGRMGMKIYTNKLGHMTNMAAMPIYGKNLKNSSSPQPIDQWLET